MTPETIIMGTLSAVVNAATALPAILEANYGQVGCFGDIPFRVSHQIVQTASNAIWSGSARYATHQRHLTHALTEFTGLDPDTFSFDFLLSGELAVDPLEILVKLWDYQRTGKPCILILGEKIYGKYRWVIKKHTIKMEHYDKHGNLIAAEVSIELLEYLRY